MTTSITLALLISIPVAVIEPGFISQSLRAGSKARKIVWVILGQYRAQTGMHVRIIVFTFCLQTQL